MKFLFLGAASALDVIGNAFIFSGVLRSNFDVSDAAEFSAMLGWAAILAACTFGGAEQIVDHKKAIPTNIIGNPSKAAWFWIIVSGVFLLLPQIGAIQNALPVLLLCSILGLRGLGRSIAYAKNKYKCEALISLIELLILVALTLNSTSILASYMWAKLFGLALRIPYLSNVSKIRLSRSDTWGYSFSSMAPALYFNIYYAALPMFVAPDVMVRFRLLQTLLLPMSFLGSLLARARIVLNETPSTIMNILDVPKRTQKPAAFLATAALPGGFAIIYVGALSLYVSSLNPIEVILCVLYCALIYHRAQLYSYVTIRIGAAARARVAMTGVFLMLTSIVPMWASGSPSTSSIFLMLSIVEFILLATSIFVLRRGRLGGEV